MKGDETQQRAEDQQACAHLRVFYMTEQIEGGRTRGWWACDLCHREFIPVASAESAWGDPCRVCMQTGGRHWTVPHVAQSPVVARQRAEQELREAVGDYLAPVPASDTTMRQAGYEQSQHGWARRRQPKDDEKMLCSFCGRLVDPEGHRWECRPI